MKIDDNLLKFPKYLPNDLEGLMFYYPEKFPPIVREFEAIAPKIAGDPAAFREYGNKSRDELWAAYEKIKADYEKGDQTDLAFLVDIDQRFNKIYCYRFWIVNYLFPDGRIHDYIVDNLKNLIRKFIDVTEDVEDFEQKVVRIQRDLLQSDYADYYLQQSFGGAKVLGLLEANGDFSKQLAEVTKLIDEHNHSNSEKINGIWHDVFEGIKSAHNADELQEAMAVSIREAEMRDSLLPVYNMLTHAVEFLEENKKLIQRHNGMLSTIDEYKTQARSRLTPDEYELFEFCYDQARNFSMYKDIMGAIDEVLLPLWFGLYDQMRQIIKASGVTMRERGTGPAAIGSYFVWYLPDELKAKVMTPDFESFNSETI
jgi:hypothetical protein